MIVSYISAWECKRQFFDIIVNNCAYNWSAHYTVQYKNQGSILKRFSIWMFNTLISLPLPILLAQLSNQHAHAECTSNAMKLMLSCNILSTHWTGHRNNAHYDSCILQTPSWKIIWKIMFPVGKTRSTNVLTCGLLQQMTSSETNLQICCFPWNLTWHNWHSATSHTSLPSLLRNVE